MRGFFMRLINCSIPSPADDKSYFATIGGGGGGDNSSVAGLVTIGGGGSAFVSFSNAFPVLLQLANAITIKITRILFIMLVCIKMHTLDISINSNALHTTNGV